jgi:hypothetical protein
MHRKLTIDCSLVYKTTYSQTYIHVDMIALICSPTQDVIDWKSNTTAAHVLREYDKVSEDIVNKELLVFLHEE